MALNRRRLKEQLKLHEAERLRIYTDTVGKVTVGIGHNLSDKGIPQMVSDLLFLFDVDDALDWIRDNLPWFDELDEIRQRVIVDMVFNMGSKVREFVGMIAAIKARDWQGAHDHMLGSLWARQTGTRAQRLAKMMLTGHDYEE